MKDYTWRFGVIFFSIFAAGVIIESGKLNQGVDLKGGVILVYEVDREALSGEAGGEGALSQAQWSKLISALSLRVNPSGTKEIVVRRLGEWQVEIIIPSVGDRELEQIKKLLGAAGALNFRMVADRTRHGTIVELATTQASQADLMNKKAKSVRNAAGDNVVGLWARVAREEKAIGGIRPLKVNVQSDIVRDAKTGTILTIPPEAFGDSKSLAFEKYLVSEGISEIDVLMAADDGFNVTGEHLGMVTRASTSVTKSLPPLV